MTMTMELYLYHHIIKILCYNNSFYVIICNCLLFLGYEMMALLPH